MKELFSKHIEIAFKLCCHKTKSIAVRAYSWLENLMMVAPISILKE